MFDALSDYLSEASDIDYHFYLPLFTWPTAMMLTAMSVMIIALVRWLVLPRVRAGRYSVHSPFYLRKWIVALATEITLESLASLYSTVYMRAWYRLMGARIGAGTEIATNLAGRYDLTEIGPDNFIADEVVYGEEDIRHGVMILEPVRTGARVFVGNEAVIPPGANIPDDVLIGVKSKPPANASMAPGDTWFGSPPIKLPTRQRFTGDASRTFTPSRRRRIARGMFEAFSTSLTPMLFITLTLCATDFVFYPAILMSDWSGLALGFVLVGIGITLIQFIIVVALKWLLMGRYQPGARPMWSWWAIRTEAVTVLTWGLAGQVLLNHLTGTPFLPFALRMLGARIGRGVCLYSFDMTEFDCVAIGDFATLNEASCLQTHLFEDRVMKVGRVEVGRGVSLGAFSTVLYDSRIGDYARLRPLTVVMKGESIPANMEWEGAPAVPAVARER